MSSGSGGSSFEPQAEPSTDDDCLDLESDSRLVFPRGGSMNYRMQRAFSQPTKQQKQLKRLRRRKRELEALVQHGTMEEACCAGKELHIVLAGLAGLHGTEPRDQASAALGKHSSGGVLTKSMQNNT